MKVLYCENCDSLVKLTGEWRTCPCQQVGGRYKEDDHVVVFSGPAVCVGVCNDDWAHAVRDAREMPQGGIHIDRLGLQAVRRPQAWCEFRRG